MFHIFSGEIERFGSAVYIVNSLCWIEATYHGKRENGQFFCFPYVDDNLKTCKYFVFDTSDQLEFFQKVYKISGIWPSTASMIATLPREALKHAVDEFDTTILESLPRIGKKTAKKILFELKWKLTDKDIQKINIDEKLYKNIIKSLKNMWFDSEKAKKILTKYDGSVTDENLSEVMMWLVDQMR